MRCQRTPECSDELDFVYQKKLDPSGPNREIAACNCGKLYSRNMDTAEMSVFGRRGWRLYTSEDLEPIPVHHADIHSMR